MNNIFNKYKVLLIDDEQDIVDILDTVLKREGFSNIFIANNGQDGIELFKKVNPDIVLLEYNYHPEKMIAGFKEHIYLSEDNKVRVTDAGMEVLISDQMGLQILDAIK